MTVSSPTTRLNKYMMKTETRSFALANIEIRAKSDDAEGKAKGYAAVFNSDSHDLGGFIERIAPHAFARSLAEAKQGKLNIFALWSHRTDVPLASTGSGKLNLSEDAHGLAFEMDTTRMTEAQLDALRDGDLRMSFGFSVRDQNWVEDEDGNVERTLLDVDLFEVSFVISPAYPDTEAALRSMEEWKAESRTIEAVDEAEEETIETIEDKRFELVKRALLARLK